MQRNSVQRSFKKGIDLGENRKRREDNFCTLRREKKTEQLFKKRGVASNTFNDMMLDYVEIKVIDDDCGFSTSSEVSPNEQNQVSSCILLEMKNAVDQIHCDDNKYKQIEGMKTIKNILESKTVESVIQAVIDTGVVKKLTRILSDDSKCDLQFHSLEIIKNICSSTNQEQIAAVVNNAVISSLIMFLFSDDHLLITSAAWTLGNIALENAFRETIFNFLPLDKLRERINEIGNMDAVEQVVWFIKNLFWNPGKKVKSNKPWYTFKKDHAIKIIPFLMICVFKYGKKSVKILKLALEIFKEITNLDEFIYLVLDSGFHHCFKELCSHPSIKIQKAVSTVIGNIIAGSKAEALEIIKLNMFPIWKQQLFIDKVDKVDKDDKDEKEDLRRIILWSIANLSTDSVENLALIFEQEDIVKKMMEILISGSFKCKEEIVYFLRSVYDHGSDSHLDILMLTNALPAITDFLSMKSNAVDIENCLRIFQKLVEYCYKNEDNYERHVKQWNQFDFHKGWDVVNQYSNHRNKDIAIIATNILVMHDHHVDKKEIENMDIGNMSFPQYPFSFSS